MEERKRLLARSFDSARHMFLFSCVCLCLFSAAGLLVLPALPEKVLCYPASILVSDASGAPMYAALSRDDEWCIPISLDKMGRWTPAVVMEIEDRRFYSHGGIDFLALIRAACQNMRYGRIKSGASTITAQVVRIANPRPRNVTSKLIEFWNARQLEAKLTKQEILELYLNRAPFGGNIRGVEAAARVYFNKSASALSLGESTLLTGLLRAPSRLRPDRYPKRAKALRDQLLLRLQKKEVFPGEYCMRAAHEPVNAGRYPMPRRAVLAAKSAMRENLPGRRVNATINANIQLMLERNLEKAISSLPDEITAAGIIVDNRRRNIVGYVGNARYGSALPGSQVDCADAPRSPGSTLKPFVYAASFAAGHRTPASLLADTPVSFRGGAPRNYDRTYRGPVSTRLALALSLNATAVRVLREVGYRQTLDLYRRLGFSYIDEDGAHYADSLVLGGCEVSLVQLAEAYATLANGGEHAPLRWTGAPRLQMNRIFSPEVAFLILDILKDERRLVPLYQQLFGQEGGSPAFKTGTSYGARDAWTVGSFGSYTTAVWFGDPSGKPHPELVGLDLAAPAALKIMRELGTVSQRHDAAPGGIFTRKVCALSGAPASEVCPHRIDDYAIRDISPQAICRMHKISGGRLVTLWPKELEQWEQMRHKGEAVENAIVNVKIIRPLDGSKMLLSGEAKKLRVFLAAESPGEQYWYLDGRFLTRSKGDGIFADIQPGIHKLSVLSGEESDAVAFEVLSSRAFGEADEENSLRTLNENR